MFRLRFGFVVIAMVLSVFGVRLVQLQGIDPKAYAAMAAREGSERVVLPAERGAIPYAELAAQLNTTEGAARVAVHRVRKRFRDLFRATIADTVDSPAEVDDEVRYVARVLGES